GRVEVRGGRDVVETAAAGVVGSTDHKRIRASRGDEGSQSRSHWRIRRNSTAVVEGDPVKVVTVSRIAIREWVGLAGGADDRRGWRSGVGEDSDPLLGRGGRV